MIRIYDNKFEMSTLNSDLWNLFWIKYGESGFNIGGGHYRENLKGKGVPKDLKDVIVTLKNN